MDTIVCDLEAAEYMNDYYVNIGAKLAKQLSSQPWKAHDMFPSQNTSHFDFRIITDRSSKKKTTIYRGSLSWPTIGISIQKKTTITKNLLS